jgi:hypothetical protein
VPGFGMGPMGRPSCSHLMSAIYHKQFTGKD